MTVAKDGAGNFPTVPAALNAAPASAAATYVIYLQNDPYASVATFLAPKGATGSAFTCNASWAIAQMQ